MVDDNAVHPPQQSSISMLEHVSSPLTAQILEFCESELFPAQTTLQISAEVGSSSNCCYDDHSSSSYTTTTLSFPPDIIKYPPAAAAAPVDKTKTKSAPTTNNADAFSIIFDEENDINSVNLDFNQFSPYQFGHQQQHEFDTSTLLQNHNIPPLTIDPHTTFINGSSITDHPHHQNDHVLGPAAAATLPKVSEDDCSLLSSMPAAPSKFMRFNPPSNCSFMDPSSIHLYLSSGNSNPTTTTLPAVETSSSGGIFGGAGNLFLDFKGDINVGGIFCPDPPNLPTPPNYNSNELQALSNESQHLINGGATSATPLSTSEITSSLEAEPYRVTSKLTTQERKEKIHRYMKKRNERNFSKKIKYACRKTLADSRPRVRGRFAKNDEFGDNNIRPTSSNNEEDTDEDVKSFHVIVKEEEENFESSDIFAHISGVNSFKCNYPIQSWI